MKIRKFEDLEAWKEARKARRMISEVTRKPKVYRDYIFCNQIRRAALSAMSNIAEGFECITDKEFIVFLGYARRSCGEVRSQLYTALDDDYINREEFDKLYNQIVLTGKKITGFILYLRRSS
ncbi:four helix bundle protein [bacterium]|nr:four helix bundle protein [bacterium]